MKDNMKVIMGATMVMVATLAIVLGLVLLAELYCSLLLRRHPRKSSSAPTNAAQLPNLSPTPSTLSPFYAQGVLRAPRSFLFPAPPQNLDDLEKQALPQEASDYHHHHQDGTNMEHLIYICNPIYVDDDDEAIIMVNNIDAVYENETPDDTYSPSRLDNNSPPLTPMKKLLPAEGPPLVSLRDARSICCSTSDSNSNDDHENGISSASPRTSPSW